MPRSKLKILQRYTNVKKLKSLKTFENGPYLHLFKNNGYSCIQIIIFPKRGINIVFKKNIKVGKVSILKKLLFTESVPFDWSTDTTRLVECTLDRYPIKVHLFCKSLSKSFKCRALQLQLNLYYSSINMY